MTVGELKAKLNDIPDEWPIVVAVDEEGNGFQPLYDVEKARWNEKWREIKLYELTEELRQKGFSGEDVDENLPPTIVLWP